MQINTANLSMDQGASKSEELDSILKPFGFEYYSGQDIIVARENGWQRGFGYCYLYDRGAPLFHMIIDCEPVRFSYAGRSFMIELWKGQYGMTTGAEIGVYYCDEPEVKHPKLQRYEAVNEDEYLYLKIILLKNGERVFRREQKHWWMTGFEVGEYSRPEELVMDASIVFSDRGMMAAFVEELLRMGYTNEEISVWGNVVRIIYSKPHSIQPVNRRSLLNRLRSWSNKRNCRIYHKVTGNCSSLPDCLEKLRILKPRIYRKLTGSLRGRGLYSRTAAWNVKQKKKTGGGR